MAITTTTTCDICGKQKQDVNHWWMLSETYLTGGFIALPWDDKMNNMRTHVCGQECAIKAFSAWMQKHIEAAAQKGKG